MKMKIVLLMLVAMCATTQANLLTNPGFEDGTYAVKNIPDSWGVYSPDYSSGWDWRSNATGAHGGSKYMSMHGAPSAYYTSGAVNQMVAVVGGVDYTFSVWSKSPHATENATVYGYFTWYDVASTWITTAAAYGSLVADVSSVGNTWTLITFDALTAPATAAWGVFNVMGTAANDAIAGGTLYDDATLIPEPVTLGLLGLGALMLRRRK